MLAVTSLTENYRIKVFGHKRILYDLLEIRSTSICESDVYLVFMG